MKITNENGKVIIEFDDEDTTSKIIKMLKDRIEIHESQSEIERASGWLGSATIDAVKAETTRQILRRVEQILDGRD